MSKKIIAIIGILIMIMGACEIYATTMPTDPGYNINNVDSDIKVKTQNIWATVMVIVQIVAVGCVVFAGLRYMFASSDQKADIKQGLIYLTIGAVLVFSAITVIQFVVDAANEIL